MQGSWTEGYTRHSPYSYGYYREMCPPHLRFCLLCKGIAPPAASDFTYCELAMGQGMSANIHAAANRGRFVGMDFNPDHAAFARALAADCGTGLRATDDSFEDFMAGDHPGYDYVCLHGGWTWISERSRSLVVRFLKQHLKPGGVFYLSYNTYPGWSVTAPLRELLTLFDANYGCEGMTGKTRIDNAITLTGELLQSGPLFLNGSGWIMERFEKLRNDPVEYLAHEFFNADWAVMYFREVAAALAEAKLRFGASALAQNNLEGFGLTEEASRFMARIENPDIRQQVWDYFCNTQFRTDIFIRGGVSLSEHERETAILGERFALTVPREDITLSLDCGMGVFQLDRVAHGAVLDILAEGHRPKYAADILRRVQGTLNARQLLGVLARLVGKGCVQPCVPSDVAAARAQTCRVLNRAILKKAELSDAFGFLASPEIGGGVQVSRLSRLFMLAESRGIDPVDYALCVFPNSGQPFPFAGPDDPSALRESVKEAYTLFRESVRPVLQGLGIDETGGAAPEPQTLSSVRKDGQ